MTLPAILALVAVTVAVAAWPVDRWLDKRADLRRTEARNRIAAYLRGRELTRIAVHPAPAVAERLAERQDVTRTTELETAATLAASMAAHPAGTRLRRLGAAGVDLAVVLPIQGPRRKVPTA